MSKLLTKLHYHQGAIAKLLGLALILVAGDALSAGMTLGTMASNVVGSFASVTKLITATAYLAGLGFAVGAIIKFKAHKDNPAQVPIGQPIGLLLVAAALLFLPTILSMAGATMFGASGGSTAGPTGTVFSG